MPYTPNGLGKNWAKGKVFTEPNTTCQYCGKKFHASPCYLKRGQYKYCSNECRGLASRGSSNVAFSRVEVMCANCGKIFQAYPSKIAKGSEKFCSRECATASKKAIALSKKACVVCGKETTRPEKKYCSQTCREKQRATRPSQKVIRTCVVCGKEFQTWKREVNRGRGLVCSLSCWGGIQTKTRETMYTRSHGGKREDLGDMYFRSAWEANYARYLNWLKSIGEIQDWQYEPDTFEFHPIKRGNRFYTPDFKVFNQDGSYEYHEVKGWMDKKSQTKLDRMSKYYPEVKIVLVDRDVYQSISRQVKGMIPGWEIASNHAW